MCKGVEELSKCQCETCKYSFVRDPASKYISNRLGCAVTTDSRLNINAYNNRCPTYRQDIDKYFDCTLDEESE